MREQRRKPWILILVAAVLMVVAVILLYITAPTPTVLLVQVVDDETGQPLAGANVRARARGEQPLPIVTTDEAGVATFHELPADLSYVIRIQKIDYDLAFEPQVAVPKGKETQVTVPLVAHAGGRLVVGLDETRVAMIDTASLSVMYTVRLTGWKQEPVRYARFHPDGQVLYALAGNEGCILDVESGASLANFAVKGTIEDLSTDGTHLFVITGTELSSRVVSQSADDESVSIVSTSRVAPSGQLQTLDAETGALLTSVPAVYPRSAAKLIWKPDGSRVYVVEPFSRELWVVDASPFEVLTRTTTGAYPDEGFLSADGAYRYVWSEDGFENLRNTFGEDMQPVPGVQSLPPSESAWALSPTSETLYVLDVDLGTLSILDLTGQEPPILVAVGKQPVAVALSPDGQWAYVANRESRTVSVIYTPSTSVVLTVPLLGESFSLALR
jgi:YVTN family beta-propeller protein